MKALAQINPAPDSRRRQIIGLVLFALASLVLWWLLRTSSPLHSLSIVSLLLDIALYVGLALLSFPTRSGTRIGFQFTMVIASFLAGGTLDAIAVGLLGSFIARFAQAALKPSFAPSRDVLMQTVIEAAFEAGLAITSALVGGLGLLIANSLLGTGDSTSITTASIYLIVAAVCYFGLASFFNPVARAVPAMTFYLWPIEMGLRMVAALVPLPLAWGLGFSYANGLPTMLWFVLAAAGVGLAYFFRYLYNAHVTLYQRVEQQQIAAQIGVSLTSTLMLPDLITRLETHLNTLTNADSSVIGLLTDGNSLSFPQFTATKQLKMPSSTLGELSRALVEHIATTRRPMLLSGSVRAESAKLGVKAQGTDDLSAFYGVPIFLDDQLLGVFAALHTQPNAVFTQEQCANLVTLANQAAPMLRNAILYMRVFEMADSLALLNNVSAVVSSTLDLETVLETISNVILEVGRADKTGIFLVDNEFRQLELKFQLNLSPEFIDAFAVVAQDPYSGPLQVLQQWSTQVIADIQRESEGMGWRKLADVEQFTSLLTVPLITDNRVIGFMAAFYVQPHTFEQSEIDLIITLANQVSVTVSNARLHQDTMQRTQELTTLVDVSRSFTSTLDLNDVVAKVLQALDDLIEPDAIMLLENNALSTNPEMHVIGRRGGSDIQTLQTDANMSKVFESRKPVFVVAGNSECSLLERLGMGAVYLLPLMNMDEAFGLAVLGFQRAQLLPEQKRQLAQAILNQGSTAIKNAQLFGQVDDALDERVNELYAIAALSRKVSASLNIDDIVDEVLNIALKVTNADVAAFALTSTTDPSMLKLIEHFNPAENLLRSVVLHPRNSGIIGQALNSKQTILVTDVTQVDNYVPSSISDIHSELSVPVIYKGEVLGVIDLECRQIDGFSSSHRSFITLMAEHIGVALNNARLFDERRSQLDSLIELRDLSLELLLSSEFKDKLHLIVSYTMKIMKARDVHLYLYNAEQEQLVFGTSIWSDGREDIEAQKPSMHGRTWQVVRSGQMLLMPDTSKETMPREFYSGDSFGAMARMPLKRGGHVFGVMVMTFRDPQNFDDNRIHTMELISNQAAIAIENARLFEEVRSKRDQMEVIFNSARDGMALIDTNGNLLLVNQVAERLLNRPLQFYVGQPIFRLMAIIRQAEKLPDNPDNFSMGIHDLLRRVNQQPHEQTRRSFTISTPSGLRDLEEETLPVLDENKQLLGRLIVMRDISEIKAEERFREEVTNTLVHDLRAPTGSMITSLRLIQDLIDMQEYGELKPVVDIALDGGEKLMSLINLLLELARAETLDSHECLLHDLVQSSAKALEATAREANIRVLNLIPTDAPPLLVDGDKVNRVFVNLLDNALRHTPVGGEVRFESSLINGRDRDYLKISVTDTGRGIPEAYWPTVFQKFVVVPKSNVRGHKGTGLGLTFCQRIVEAHGGHIWVDRGPEGGAAIWLTLPVAILTPQSIPSVPPQSADLKTVAD